MALRSETVSSISRSGTTFTAKNSSGGTLFTFSQKDDDTVYTHPTGAGYGHIPSGGSAGQVLGYGGSSGTASWQDAESGGIELPSNYKKFSMLGQDDYGNLAWRFPAGIKILGTVQLNFETIDDGGTFSSKYCNYTVKSHIGGVSCTINQSAGYQYPTIRAHQRKNKDEHIAGFFYTISSMGAMSVTSGHTFSSTLMVNYGNVTQWSTENQNLVGAYALFGDTASYSFTSSGVVSFGLFNGAIWFDLDLSFKPQNASDNVNTYNSDNALITILPYTYYSPEFEGSIND